MGTTVYGVRGDVCTDFVIVTIAESYGKEMLQPKYARMTRMRSSNTALWFTSLAEDWSGEKHRLALTRTSPNRCLDENNATRTLLVLLRFLPVLDGTNGVDHVF